MKTIELPECKVEQRWRVYAEYPDGSKKLLFSGGIEKSCEAFCWAYDGDAHTLYIQKVWIKTK